MSELTISNGPHVKAHFAVQKVMMIVFIALMPATIAGVYNFGLPALYTIVSCLISAWLTDIACQKLAKQKFKIINWSSLLTGLLLALVLPPATHPLLCFIGSFVSITIGKYVFGKGNNIFNPALVGRTFLSVSFPAMMAGWIIPDATTAATPLTILKEGGVSALINAYGSTELLYKALFFGNVGGSLGETSALALLIGGLALIILGPINWRIPTMYLSTVAIISQFAGRDVIVDLISGGLLIGALFMATDYVTSPITRNGRIIFGIGCGILTMIFRIYSAMPEGVCFSILLMNALVPLIERYTKPKPFGR